MAANINDSTAWVRVTSYTFSQSHAHQGWRRCFTCLWSI